MKDKPYLFIALAAVFWSVQGVLGKFLASDLEPMQTAFARIFVGFLFIFAFTFIRHKEDLKIDANGMFKLAVMGIVCQSGTSMFFFHSVSKTSVAAATALMYTAPIFAIFISRMVFGEKITPLKLLAVAVCSVGVFQTVTMGNFSVLTGSVIGVLSGLGAGLVYSLNSIIGKSLMRKYSNWAVLTYSFGFGALFMSPFCNPIGILPMLGKPNVIFGIIMMGLVPTFCAFGFYFTGIAKGALPSKVGIVATLEVALAVIWAAVLFGEPMGIMRALGICGIFAAVYILYVENSRADKATVAATAPADISRA
ncbi:hypothetical protein EAL2_808p06760 (plasmid) [Peptoclostridium acidaminophilum DSM 3953]|uniref:EamA domain-containing protein n=1 Tax=Peptoclostridium acidaminophilum DSM 3953 TaxID=1286171 RepID=W8T942_PEPAC|nr:DMT family transporter [Peptoclostridium acidaminophilum]AHM58179.1 hypothetical protein EAL2_808p06760 [Peptoclostridium acidaminophilum DSM 3953]